MRAGVSHTNSLLMERQNNRESVKCLFVFSAGQDKLVLCPLVPVGHQEETEPTQCERVNQNWTERLSLYLSCDTCVLSPQGHKVIWKRRALLADKLQETQRNVSSNSIFLLAAHDRSKKKCKTISVVMWWTVCPETGRLLVLFLGWVKPKTVKMSSLLGTQYLGWIIRWFDRSNAEDKSRILLGCDWDSNFMNWPSYPHVWK